MLRQIQPWFGIHSVAVAVLCAFASIASAQKLGEERKQTFNSNIRVTNSEGRKTKTFKHMSDEGWVVVKYEAIERNKIGTASFGTSYVQANSKFLTSTEVQNEYRSMKQYLGNFGISDVVKIDVKKKLDEEEREYLKYSQQTESSHRAVICEVEARGQGFGKGDSRISVDVVVTERYVGKSKDLQQRRDQWKAKIEQLASTGGNGGGVQNDSRNSWVHSKGRFVKDGQIWTETDPVGSKFNFKEVRRTPEFVEINDASRRLTVRLRNDRSEWSQGNDRWNGLYTGRWR